MAIDSQILLMLSAFGALNGIFIAIYFFMLKPVKLSNQFLAGMILMVSIRILKSVLFYFNPEITKTILQIGLSACFFIGPFLYLYCASKVGGVEKQRVTWQLHLGGLLIFVLVIGFAYPYQSNPQLWGSVFYKTINYVWLFYLVLSAIILIPTFKKLTEKKSAFLNDDIWLLSVYVGNVVIWFAYFTASYTSYIVGALSSSFVFYLLCLLFVFKFREGRDKAALKYSNKKIISSEAEDLIIQLEAFMEKELAYKNANLTMPVVAKHLGLSSTRLSQLLNDNLNKPFALFVNEYRIAAAQKLLLSEKAIKMEVIAEMCGFNSQSTFYSAFKKITDSTPAKYREESKRLTPPEL